MSDRTRLDPTGGPWLLWSRYHNAWHRRDSEGHAAGYVSDVAGAGVFDYETAAAYHSENDRNRAVAHAEALPMMNARRVELQGWLDALDANIARLENRSGLA